MNIALSAVIIFLLLLPPIAFYLAFTLGKFPKSGPKIGLLEGLMLSAIFSILLRVINLNLHFVIFPPEFEKTITKLSTIEIS